MGHSNVDVDFQYTLGLQSQSIDSANAFSQAYIPSGEPVFIEHPRDFNSDVGQYDGVLILNKSLYCQAKAARLWCGNFRDGLLDHDFVMNKVDTYLFMSKTVIFVVYVDDFLFWARSQYDIDNLMKSFKEYG